MARKKKRARAAKKRYDYRGGGRVRLQYGGGDWESQLSEAEKQYVSPAPVQNQMKELFERKPEGTGTASPLPRIDDFTPPPQRNPRSQRELYDEAIKKYGKVTVLGESDPRPPKAVKATIPEGGGKRLPEFPQPPTSPEVSPLDRDYPEAIQFHDQQKIQARIAQQNYDPANMKIDRMTMPTPAEREARQKSQRTAQRIAKEQGREGAMLLQWKGGETDEEIAQALNKAYIEQEKLKERDLALRKEWDSQTPEQREAAAVARMSPREKEAFEAHKRFRATAQTQQREGMFGKEFGGRTGRSMLNEQMKMFSPEEGQRFQQELTSQPQRQMQQAQQRQQAAPQNAFEAQAQQQQAAPQGDLSKYPDIPEEDYTLPAQAQQQRPPYWQTEWGEYGETPSGQPWFGEDGKFQDWRQGRQEKREADPRSGLEKTGDVLKTGWDILKGLGGVGSAEQAKQWYEWMKSPQATKTIEGIKRFFKGPDSQDIINMSPEDFARYLQSPTGKERAETALQEQMQSVGYTPEQHSQFMKTGQLPVHEGFEQKGVVADPSGGEGGDIAGQDYLKSLGLTTQTPSGISEYHFEKVQDNKEAELTAPPGFKRPSHTSPWSHSPVNYKNAKTGKIWTAPNHDWTVPEGWKRIYEHDIQQMALDNDAEWNQATDSIEQDGKQWNPDDFAKEKGIDMATYTTPDEDLKSSQDYMGGATAFKDAGLSYDEDGNLIESTPPGQNPPSEPVPNGDDVGIPKDPTLPPEETPTPAGGPFGGPYGGPDTGKQKGLFNAYEIASSYGTQPAPYVVDGKPRGDGPWHRPSPVSGVDPLETGMTHAELEREYRTLRAGMGAEYAAAGELPEGAILPDAAKTDATIEAEAKEIGEVDKATATGVKEITAETIATDLAEKGRLPDGYTAGSYAASLNLLKQEIPAATLEDLDPRAIPKVDEIRRLSGPAKAAEIAWKLVEQSKARDFAGVISGGAYVPEVKGALTDIAPTDDAQKDQRNALTGFADQREEAKIPEAYKFESASRDLVTGVDATGSAADMVSALAEIPPEIAAATVQDPAIVLERIDQEDVEVQAAIAALPPEALVSAQMESLIGGLESGEVPPWAKPAVDAINQRLVQRGMDISTVGRDSLYNAIITTAFPMAQSNAQALQTRAAQNLTHEQQANIEESRLDMTRRMTNLANQQTSSSQSAQMAQQMKVLQSQFDQEAAMGTVTQRQQTRVQDLSNRQQTALTKSQNQQQINAQELGVEAQIDLAELQIADATARENMTADQQGRMLEYQTAHNFMAQNAAFTQDMRKANMTSEQQIKLANLTHLNQASSENLTARQQVELANLNKRMQVNIAQGELASKMDLANLSAAQQRAVENAHMVTNMDMANFNFAQQVELTNSKFMQTVTLQDFNQRQQAAMQNATALASLDLAAVDQRTKIAAQKAQSFLQLDMTNLSNEQQANMLEGQITAQRLLSNQAADNAAKQFNATSENQTNQFLEGLEANMEQFNTTQVNAMTQFNNTQKNAAEARRTDRQGKAALLDAQQATEIDKFNTQLEYNKDQWNTQNAQAVEQSNVTWRRQSNQADTVAANQVSMQNAQNAFNLSSQAQSFLWQELRDEADYVWRSSENHENRKTELYAISIANEARAAQDWNTMTTNMSTLLGQIFLE